MHPIKVYPRPDRPDNPTSLEMAIYNFELKAKLFHDENNKKNPSSEMLKKLTMDYDHLQREKKRIESVSVAQTALTTYRSNNRIVSEDTLLEEEHHPTNNLTRFLNAVGEPKPTTQHEAHHIISGKGRYNQVAIMRARLNLHMAGIGINDPFNGIWLINFLKNKQHDWATKDSPPHRKLHRYNYETWIGESLGGNMGGSEALLLNNLRNVKTKIRTGTLPDKIFEKKDELWKGI
jgi:hypothetical protein